MNILYVFEHGDTVLISTFLLLLAMSLTSWYIIIWKVINLKAEKSSLTNFLNKYATTPNWPQKVADINIGSKAISTLLAQSHLINEVIKSQPNAERKELLSIHMTQTLDKLRTNSEKGLTILASIGSSAPFIGLFGTVWGVYRALAEIAAAGNASLNVVAGPMGEALVATAFGLFAAIPAVLAFNTFNRLNRTLSQDYRHLAEHIINYPAVKTISINQE